MSALAGLTAEPNRLNIFEGTNGCPGGSIGLKILNFIFKNQISKFDFFKIRFFSKKNNGQRRALQPVLYISNVTLPHLTCQVLWIVPG